MVIKISFKFSIDFTLCRGVYGNYECKIPHSTEHFVLIKYKVNWTWRIIKYLKIKMVYLMGKLNVWVFGD